MSTYNEGRNEIRVANSDGRCLLENWVEERAVSNLDPINMQEGMTSKAQVFRSGHRGLLTKEFDAVPEKDTSFLRSYKPPPGPPVPLFGVREKLLEQSLFEKAWMEVHNDWNQHYETSPEDYLSVTHADFNKTDFVPKKPTPTAHHDYMTDQPVTFWTDHRDVIHGVSQVKTLDTVFRKNNAFSRPISEHWDQPKPYELEMVPKM